MLKISVLMGRQTDATYQLLKQNLALLRTVTFPILLFFNNF